MLDIKWIRSNKEAFDNMLARRGEKALSTEISRLDEEKRALTTLVQQLQHARNEKAKMLSFIKDKNSREFELARRDAVHINDKLEELSAKLNNDDKLSKILETVPNMLSDDVPDGEDENDNKVVNSWGTPRKIANPKSHVELGEELGQMDFQQTAKISGSRFVTLSSDLARLERAIANFMLEQHAANYGYIEVSPPLLVRSSAMYGAGQLPKFAEESFETTNGYRLIPTSEVSLVSLVAERVMSDKELPLRMMAYTPCFRSEAGSAGKDTKGMIRLHQFNKVELVSITTPEDSHAEHERILSAAQDILKALELPFRTVALCAGDIGFHSMKTYDLEVWIPSQDKYREISSISNCGDFQARRMKSRYKHPETGESIYVHTLNGSGLAVGRTLVAIMENNQNEDGSISIPTVLQKYMSGQKKIERQRELA